MAAGIGRSLSPSAIDRRRPDAEIALYQRVENKASDTGAGIRTAIEIITPGRALPVARRRPKRPVSSSFDVIGVLVTVIAPDKRKPHRVRHGGANCGCRVELSIGILDHPRERGNSTP